MLLSLIRPTTIEQTKFEYSPVGKIFNMGIKMIKKGLFKRLKNIEDKNEDQLKLLSNANKTSNYIKKWKWFLLWQ